MNRSCWAAPELLRQIVSGLEKTHPFGFFTRTFLPTPISAGCSDSTKAIQALRLSVLSRDRPKRCGIAAVDQSGRIEHFVEKPNKPPGDLAFAGILIGTQRLLDVVPQKCPADIGFDVLPALAGQMLAYTIDDFLLDVGTIESYERAQRNWPG